MSIEITKVYKEHFPALRFIGTCYTNEDRDSAGGFGKQWDEWMNNDRFSKLKAAILSAPFDESPIGLMTMHGDMTGFTYWIGLFFPADAAVPEGYASIDLPESNIGVGWVCGKEENGEIYGDAHGEVCKKLDEDGFNSFRNDITGENTYCFLRDIILYVLHRKTQTEMLPLTMETIFYNKSLNQEIADAEHGHPFFLEYKDFRNSHIKKLLTGHV